jgi:hypothetical protein
MNVAEWHARICLSVACCRPGPVCGYVLCSFGAGAGGRWFATSNSRNNNRRGVDLSVSLAGLVVIGGVAHAAVPDYGARWGR